MIMNVRARLAIAATIAALTATVGIAAPAPAATDVSAKWVSCC